MQVIEVTKIIISTNKYMRRWERDIVRCYTKRWEGKFWGDNIHILNTVGEDREDEERIKL
jgi:hypothetical protein